MRRSCSLTVAIATAFLVAVFSLDASANCVQPPVVLPGLSGGPVWLPPTPGSTAWRAQLQDPRWSGGPVTFFSALSGGTLSDEFDAQYRVVYQGNNLFVSIQTVIDPSAPNLTDAVYFGITGGTASSGAYLFEIAPDTTDPPVSDPTGTVQHDTAFPIPNSNGYITYFTTLNRTVATPSWCQAYPASLPAGCPPALPNPPAFLKNVATWTNSPGVQWAVTLQIDTTAIAAGPVQMFFGSRINTSPGTTVILTSSPQFSASNPEIGDTPAGASVTGWLNFDPLGNACPGGITISPSTVGVWNGSTITNAVNTCPIPPNPPGTTCTNKFRVEAQNVPAGAPVFGVIPRIRVADWGSMIADPNAPWIDFGIPANVFTQPQSYFTGNPQWAWTPSGATTVDIDYTCALNPGARYCPAVPGSTQPHQCMLFEIGIAPGVTGAGWNIQTAAVFQNMEFGTLSKLSEPARITLKGLQALTGAAADRDIYVYLQTQNLPPHGRAPMELPEREMASAQQYSMHPPPIPRARVDIKGGQAPTGATPGLLDLPLLTGDQALASVYPTYRVFPYYDSGKTMVVKGKTQKILVPMTPFGLYLDHKGTFYGFNHSLEFLDANAEEVAPHFYRIHMRNEGEIHVRTNVSAEEQPPGVQPPPPVDHGHHCDCRMVGTPGWSLPSIGAVGLGVVALALRSRRRRR
jgi:hypothetical protein